MLKSMSYKSLKDTLFKITPTCFGSQRIHHQGVITCTLTEITCNGSQIFIMCVVCVWPHICHQTPTTHVINIRICEPLQVISVKVQVIIPWWWILCDPKHVGVIFNNVFLNFYMAYILTSTYFIIECISQLIKVTKLISFSTVWLNTPIVEQQCLQHDKKR